MDLLPKELMFTELAEVPLPQPGRTVLNRQYTAAAGRSDG